MLYSIYVIVHPPHVCLALRTELGITMMKTVTITGVAFTLAGRVAAWGETGHQAVGYIAMEFLAPKALAFVQSTVDSSYDNSLGPAAVWADSVKYTTGYTFSAPYHFIDAEDDPLGGSCSVGESTSVREFQCFNS